MKILLIGEGHGFQALVDGFGDSDLEVCILDENGNLDINTHQKPIIQGYLTKDISRNFDLVLSSGYRRRILPEILHTSVFLNIHYALFPRYRGMHSIVWAMLNGEKNIGVTLHEMDEGLDSGPIIWQHSVEVGQKTSWELMLECNHIVSDKIEQVLRRFISKEVISIPQNEDFAFYVGKRNKEDCRIDWNKWDVVFFERSLNALVVPYPRPFFKFQELDYEILEAEVIHMDYLEINGHILYVDQDSVRIKIPGGILNIRSLVSPNGDTLKANQILNKIGLRLSN